MCSERERGVAAETKLVMWAREKQKDPNITSGSSARPQASHITWTEASNCTLHYLIKSISHSQQHQTQPFPAHTDWLSQSFPSAVSLSGGEDEASPPLSNYNLLQNKVHSHKTANSFIWRFQRELHHHTTQNTAEFSQVTDNESTVSWQLQLQFLQLQ